MKKIFSVLFITCFALGAFNKLEAQRRENQGRSSTQPVRTFPNTNRSATVRTNTSTNRIANAQRNGNIVSRNPTPANRGGVVTSSPIVRRSYPQRSVITTPRNMTASRSYRQPAVLRSYNNPGTYRYSNYHSNSYYRTGYNYRPVFMYGPRYTYVPRASISINFGGRPYYYNRGYFYGYYSGYYQPIFPPFGIRINVLPIGYSSIFIGPDPFYYYNGIYYRPYKDNTYEVVDAPMGATVSSLPKGAKSVVVNGEKLYELNGTYYKADRNNKGEDVYIVVGKYGEINNTTDVGTSSSTSAPLQAGDVISQLPEGSRVVTINGEKLYVTPDNIFLNENTVDGVVQYTVVGK